MKMNRKVRISLFLGLGTILLFGVIALALGATTVGLNLVTDGNLTINGNTTLGDNASDTVTINGTPTFSTASTFTQTATFNATTDITTSSGQALTITPTGAAAITLGTSGSGNTTSITLNTDGTGDAEIVLPSGSIGSSEHAAIDSPADEECLTYESTGTAFEWQNCAGTLQATYNSGATIETASNTAVLVTETTAAANTNDLLQLTTGAATGGTMSGDALQISLDAADANANTGHGIHIIIDQSQNTGDAIRVLDDLGATYFSVSEAGAVSATSLTLSGGAAITKHLSASYTLNFSAPPSVPNCVYSTGQTLTGAAVGDTAVVSTNATGQGSTFILQGFVSAANTVTIYWCQLAGAALDPDGAGGGYRVDVWQH